MIIMLAKGYTFSSLDLPVAVYRQVNVCLE